ncbi:MAG: hypothetical protein FWB96_01510 [Defluviitaleaceae bacterium]|nr:hypothetical protein [Defluviitaleaceae bacterium]MCL2261629.1 hypothetical protein [Defluviitaleaceae bacterium]
MKGLTFILLFLGLTAGVVGCGNYTTEPTVHERIIELINQAEEALERARSNDVERERLLDAVNSEEVQINLYAALAGMSRTLARELAEEALEIAYEHGIDIMEIVEQRANSDIVFLVERARAMSQPLTEKEIQAFIDLGDNFEFSYDQFDSRLTIWGYRMSVHNVNSTSILSSVQIVDGRMTPPSLTFRYVGSTRLNLDRITVFTGNGGEDLAFRRNDIHRDTHSGGVHEERVSLSTAQTWTIMRSLISSSETTVRFRGDRNADHQLNSGERSGIKNLLEFHDMVQLRPDLLDHIPKGWRN